MSRANPPFTRPPRPGAVVIAVLLVAEIVSAFETTMVYNALPRLIVALHTNAADASWAVTAFLLVAAASAAVCGRLGDVYGRRRLLIVVLLASAVGSVVSLSTGTLAGVIAGRAIQGVAGAILPLCFGLAREMLPAGRVPVAVATIAGAALVAGATGNLVSGVLIDRLSWHYIFVVAALLALVAAAGALLLRPSPARVQGHRVDVVGGVLFAPAIGLVLFGVTQSRAWTWLDARTIGAVAGGLALLALWAVRELRVTHPMINLRLLRDRKLALTMVATALLSLGPIGVTGFLLPLILQTPETAPGGYGLSATTAGALSFAVAALAFLLAPVSGRIAAAAGARRPLLLGAVLGVAGVAALALLPHAVGSVLVASLLLGASTAFAYTALPTLVVEAVPVENTSEATGVNVVTRTAFQGVATSVATVILASSTVPGTPYATGGAYLAVFGLVAGCCLLTVVVALAIRPDRSGPGAAPAIPDRVLAPRHPA